MPRVLPWIFVDKFKGVNDGINRIAHEKVRLPHEKKNIFLSFRPYKCTSHRFIKTPK